MPDQRDRSEKPALDQIIDDVALHPGKTFDFYKGGRVVACVVSYDWLQDLRGQAGHNNVVRP